MSWCAKERDGKETIFTHKPKFDDFNGQYSDELTKWEDNGSWDGRGYERTLRYNSRIIVPKGTIELVTGVKLRCCDGPIRFKRQIKEGQ